MATFIDIRHFLSYILLMAPVLVFSSCKKPKMQESYDFTPLEEMIEVWMERNYYPGGSIAVADGNGTLYEKYFGKYSSDDDVAVAFAGIWVAAATVGAAVENSGLAWDDCVEKWIPEFCGDSKGKITLRQLMSHTSGVRPCPEASETDIHHSLDSAVMKILAMEPVFRTGSRFQYGGLGMQIAERMVEKATGMDFDEFFLKQIAAPLDMSHSAFTPVGPEPGSSPMPGGGFRTSLHDYMHFLDMIFHDGVYCGKRILSESTVREMEADQIRGAAVEKGEYVERGLGLEHKGIYGLGVWREILDEDGEAVQLGSPGWAGAYPWINRKDGVYGFFLTHVEGNSAAHDDFSPFYNAPKISGIVSKIVNHTI